MNASDVLNLTFAMVNIRTTVFRIIAERNPKASVDELMREADRVMAWAENRNAAPEVS